MAQPRGALVGAGAGLAWLIAAAFLGLSALLAAYFSIAGFAIVGAWAIAAGVLGIRLLRRGTDVSSHRFSIGAAVASALIAARLALLPGTELLWSVVVLGATAGIYSLVAIHELPTPSDDLRGTK